MKKYILFICLSILLFACGGDSEQTMTVTGKVKGLKKGILYLQNFSDSTVVTIDSLQIDGDGSFTFKKELESPELFYLYLDKKDNNEFNDRITFFGEPGVININTTWNTFEPGAKIEGSVTHEKFVEYKAMMSEFNKRDIALAQEANNTEQPLDAVQIDSIRKISDRNFKRSYAFSITYALTHKNSYIAPYIAAIEIPEANPVFLDSIYKSLPENIANSKYGLKLKKRLENTQN